MSTAFSIDRQGSSSIIDLKRIKYSLPQRGLYRECKLEQKLLEAYINPFDGKGNGVIKYAWTASQYL